MHSIFYVYALVDPRDNRRFYIGKGCGGRAQSHLKRRSVKNGGKQARIDAIRANGLEVVVEIIENNMTEANAFALERKLIAETSGLSNILRGGQGMSRRARAENAIHMAAQLFRQLKTGEQVLAEGGYRLPNGTIVDVGTRLKALRAVLNDIMELVRWSAAHAN